MSAPDRLPARAIDWTKYPSRVCQMMHHCRICRLDILLGDAYFDGGYGRRAHVSCAIQEIAE